MEMDNHMQQEEQERPLRTGPPDISGTYSLLVLNISFRTTPNDLTPLFDKYGEVVDCYIPRNRRNGHSRGFAFVRFRKEEDARKAMEEMDGREVDGRSITVQFAKYGRGEERRERRSFRTRSSRSFGGRNGGPRFREDSYRRRRSSRSPERSRHSRRRHSRSPRRRHSPRRSISPPRRRREERDYSHSASNPRYSEDRMRDVDEKEVVYERR
ncbi:Serine/arginine-rich splicing factor SC35 [Galdieria sulphuraria]|uniref:Splicing factor, arginine/serine-rich 2 n=1 Tax=Galdieria sulphuraria TaxID=130081 RepID=M2W289_GALSU|nr:splicing factor, arginine/serine-rich 2 [Galdieria sulphuraria]EME29811.1 splicing factor, arginine/serine-rich 2 [Galdieria sulphuraria]GJD06800.1 Serine/arginine-rich splicing factor SC35 [Galdieria sulphuraria]|eukprot:XP_005706331.1 splicing factor, arginine/serine-rich 2 [Galdieria sulphuraria]